MDLGMIGEELLRARRSRQSSTARGRRFAGDGATNSKPAFRGMMGASRVLEKRSSTSRAGSQPPSNAAPESGISRPESSPSNQAITGRVTGGEADDFWIGSPDGMSYRFALPSTEPAEGPLPEEG
jgi:hypothetical protein